MVPAVHDSTCRPEAWLIGKFAGPVILEAIPVGVAASVDEVFAVANGARLRRFHPIQKGQELTDHRDFLRGTDVSGIQPRVKVEGVVSIGHAPAAVLPKPVEQEPRVV